MAIHYLCKYGIDLDSENFEAYMQIFVDHKSKFSQVGGWNKYTPLIYACTYGHYEIA